MIINDMEGYLYIRYHLKGFAIMSIADILDLVINFKELALYSLVLLFLFGTILILLRFFPKFFIIISKLFKGDIENITKEERTLAFNIGVPIILFTIMAFLIIHYEISRATYLNNMSQSEDTGVFYIKNITIDENYHHIGNFNSSLLFPESPNYEGTHFIKHFNLSFKSDNMYISMKTRDIDPDVERGPASIFINGKFYCYLNSFVDIERQFDEEGNFIDNFAPIDIKVNPDLFNIGENSIVITVGNGKEKVLYLDGEKLYEYPFTNKDDIEFWDLEIKFEDER